MPIRFLAARSSAILSIALVASAPFILPASAANTAKPSASGSPPAPAASAQGQAAPVEPGMTTADFGDWVLRCQPIKTGTDTRRVCEVGESIQVQGQQNPIARLAIGRLNKTDPLRVTILLPNNIALPSSVRVGPATQDTSSVELPWRRCLPGACVADTEIKDDTLKAWRGVTDAGKIAFKDAAGRDVTLPFSFKGLPLALDALAKENRDS